MLHLFRRARAGHRQVVAVKLGDKIKLLSGLFEAYLCFFSKERGITLELQFDQHFCTAQYANFLKGFKLCIFGLKMQENTNEEQLHLMVRVLLVHIKE